MILSSANWSMWLNYVKLLKAIFPFDQPCRVLGNQPRLPARNERLTANGHRNLVAFSTTSQVQVQVHGVGLKASLALAPHLPMFKLLAASQYNGIGFGPKAKYPSQMNKHQAPSRSQVFGMGSLRTEPISFLEGGFCQGKKATKAEGGIGISWKHQLGINSRSMVASFPSSLFLIQGFVSFPFVKSPNCFSNTSISAISFSISH